MTHTPFTFKPTVSMHINAAPYRSEALSKKFKEYAEQCGGTVEIREYGTLHTVAVAIFDDLIPAKFELLAWRLCNQEHPKSRLELTVAAQQRFDQIAFG